MDKMKFVLLEDARRAALNANSKLVWCIDNLPVFTLGKNVEMVVRCKDCKHWGGSVYGGRCKHWSAPLSGITHFTCADDFCSYGERKDSE